MRRLLSGVLFIGGVVAVHLVSARAAEPKLDCRHPAVQMEMNACAELDFEKADKALNRLWPTIVADAKARSADLADVVKERGVPTPLEALLAAEHAWIAYRDAECSYEPYSAFGGTMQPMIGSMCKARITRARIAELKATLSQP